MRRASRSLRVLIQNSDRVLEKDWLLKTLWPDPVVEEHDLSQQISCLRKVLGEQITMTGSRNRRS